MYNAISRLLPTFHSRAELVGSDDNLINFSPVVHDSLLNLATDNFSYLASSLEWTAFLQKFVLCYCISFHHFSVFVENFTSYVTLYLYVR